MVAAMRNYIELTISPDADCVNHALSALMKHLHLACAENPGLAVGFPDYSEIGLGARVRVFGDVTGLEGVRARLPKNMRVGVGPVSEVPAEHGWIRYSRVRGLSQAKLRRLARRAEARGEEPLAVEPHGLREPFVWTWSSTTARWFPLHVRAESCAVQGSGTPDSYGLSREIAVPSF